MPEESAVAREPNEEITINVSAKGLKVNLPASYSSGLSGTGEVEGHEFDEEDVQERMFHVNVGCCSLD